jgi:acyl carrier protein
MNELDMTTSSVTEPGAAAQLKRVFAEILLIDDDDYRDEYGPDEIASWDSLATVTLAGALEKEFGIPVPADDMAAFNTIGDVKQFCRSNGINV